jgi:hypothetical protein
MESKPVLDEVTLGKIVFDLCLDEDLHPSYDLVGAVMDYFFLSVAKNYRVGQEFADRLLLHCEREEVYPKEVFPEIRQHHKAHETEKEGLYRRFLGFLLMVDLLYVIAFVVCGMLKKWQWLWIAGIVVGVVAFVILVAVVLSAGKGRTERLKVSKCPMFEGNREEILTEPVDLEVFDRFLGDDGYPSCAKAQLAIMDHRGPNLESLFSAPAVLVTRPLRRYLKVIGLHYPEEFQKTFGTMLSLYEKEELVPGTAEIGLIRVVIWLLWAIGVGVFAAGVATDRQPLAVVGAIFLFICQVVPALSEVLREMSPPDYVGATLEADCRKAVPVIDPRQREERAVCIAIMREVCEGRWNRRPFAIPPEIDMGDPGDRWWTPAWIKRLVRGFGGNSKKSQTSASQQRGSSGDRRVFNEQCYP